MRYRSKKYKKQRQCKTLIFFIVVGFILFLIVRSFLPKSSVPVPKIIHTWIEDGKPPNVMVVDELSEAFPHIFENVRTKRMPKDGITMIYIGATFPFQIDPRISGHFPFFDIPNSEKKSIKNDHHHHNKHQHRHDSLLHAPRSNPMISLALTGLINRVLWIHPPWISPYSKPRNHFMMYIGLTRPQKVVSKSYPCLCFQTKDFLKHPKSPNSCQVFLPNQSPQIIPLSNCDIKSANISLELEQLLDVYAHFRLDERPKIMMESSMETNVHMRAPHWWYPVMPSLTSSSQQRSSALKSAAASTNEKAARQQLVRTTALPLPNSPPPCPIILHIDMDYFNGTPLKSSHASIVAATATKAAHFATTNIKNKKNNADAASSFSSSDKNQVFHVLPESSPHNSSAFSSSSSSSRIQQENRIFRSIYATLNEVFSAAFSPISLKMSSQTSSEIELALDYWFFSLLQTVKKTLHHQSDRSRTSLAAQNSVNQLLQLNRNINSRSNIEPPTRQTTRSISQSMLRLNTQLENLAKLNSSRLELLSRIGICFSESFPTAASLHSLPSLCIGDGLDSAGRPIMASSDDDGVLSSSSLADRLTALVEGELVTPSHIHLQKQRVSQLLGVIKRATHLVQFVSLARSSRSARASRVRQPEVERFLLKTLRSTVFPKHAWREIPISFSSSSSSSSSTSKTSIQLFYSEQLLGRRAGWQARHANRKQQQK